MESGCSFVAFHLEEFSRNKLSEHGGVGPNETNQSGHRPVFDGFAFALRRASDVVRALRAELTEAATPSPIMPSPNFRSAAILGGYPRKRRRLRRRRRDDFASSRGAVRRAMQSHR